MTSPGAELHSALGRFGGLGPIGLLGFSEASLPLAPIGVWTFDLFATMCVLASRLGEQWR
jgi:hypothetical protein